MRDRFAFKLRGSSNTNPDTITDDGGAYERARHNPDDGCGGITDNCSTDNCSTHNISGMHRLSRICGRCHHPRLYTP